MTNLNIVTNEAIAQGIFTEEEAEQFFAEFGQLPLFTFAEWKKRGYQVKKGEKAKMICSIWRKKGKKAEQADEESNEREFYLTKAFFFTADQVKKIEE